MSRFFAMEERELEKIISLHNDLEKIKAEASKKDIQEITAIIKSEIENMGDLFEIKDGIAHIPIIGELSEQPSLSAKLFGTEQTTFGSIIDNINKAVADYTVEKIVFEIDSPGGTVNGTDQTAIAIKAIEKPTEARVHNMAASAAFWLAAQTDKIIALNPTVEVGSIGVAVEIFDDSERDKKEGIKIHTIVSSGAEDKRPDVGTKEGRDKIKDRLTEIHNVFVSRIAEGRGVSEETVREDFGKGGVLIASKALEVGMIDGIMDGDKMITVKKQKKDISAENDNIDDVIITEIVTEPARGAGINNEEVITMTKEELKAQNSDLYKEIFEAGKNAEHEMVAAHAEWFDVAPKETMAAIQNREEYTMKHASKYSRAQLNQNDLDDVDSDQVGDVQTSTDKPEDEIVHDTVAAVVALKKGA